MNWREIQRQNFTRWDKLIDFLQIDPDSLLLKPNFPLNLPRRLAEKIEKGNLQDPIFKQFVPTQEEEKRDPLFLLDPVGDAAARDCGKLLHKYEGRVLLVCTSACAMHCRYCFRQNFDYELQEKGFAKELEVIRKDPTIREVILSGGDPLSLSNEVLGTLLQDLDAIAHVKRVRFHTRFPIGIPERIDEPFVALLHSLRCQVWFVIHCNHPKELDAALFDALQQVQKSGAILLNQSVLLRGVNDSVAVLKELSEQLVDHGILPYYLHQLDRVQGAMHFEVPEEEGRALILALTAELSGYAVPRYVREIAGEPGKTVLA